MNVTRSISVAAVVAAFALASGSAQSALLATTQVDADLRTGGTSSGSPPGTVSFSTVPGVNDSFGTVGGTPNGATSVASGGVGIPATGTMLLSGNGTDIGAGSTFTFTYSMPLSAPLSGPVTINTLISFSLTPSTTSTQLLAPVGGAFLTTRVDGCTAVVDGGAALNEPANSGSPIKSYTPTFTASQVFTPTAACNANLTTVVTFTGSGDLAQYGFTATVNVIPEPTGAALAAMAFAGLAGVRRRRRNAAAV